MRLRTLEIVRVDGPVAGLAGAAAGQDRRAGLWLRVRDDAGGIGQGEASPLPGYSPDTIEQCAAQLAAVDLAALPSPEHETALAWMVRVLEASALAAPAARFGFETALLDWLGQQRGHSIAQLLGGAGSTTRRIALAALVADADAARAAFARGIRTFKLKISPATFDADLRLAQTLRDEFGNDVALRFDANGGLDPAAAGAQLQRLAPFAPEFVEEPVPFEALQRLHATALPLAADESLARAGAWPALASVCRVLVLKPTLLGGLCACLQLAREAAALDLAVTVTHAFDGPIALTAAAELAAALPGRVLACGLDRHGGLAAWPAIAIPQLHAAKIGSGGRPGLGLAAPA